MNLTTLIYHERIIHSVKTALACLVGFIVASHLHFQATQWIIITTLVVMAAQMNVGSMIQKSYMRFLGTLTGSLVSILTLKLFGNDPLVSLGVVLIAAMVFSFIATSGKSYNESGALGAVTVTIILFGQNPTAQTGVERFFEISLGILIAAIISQFILPVHAKNHLKRSQAETIKKIHTFYLDLFSRTLSSDNMNALGNLDEQLVKSLMMQRKLAVEARREKLGKSFNIDYFQQSLSCEKDIIRSIILMFYAYQKIGQLKIMQENHEILTQFNQQVSDLLQMISQGIPHNAISKDYVLPNVLIWKQIFSDVSALKYEERVAIDTFIFCGEMLVERLDRMVGLLMPEKSHHLPNK